MTSPAGPPADVAPGRPEPEAAEVERTAGERRRFLVAGAVFLGALVVLVALTTLLSGDAGDPRPTATTEACAPDDAECLAAQQSVERPGIIPRPGEGQAPDEPGDRGGWEQWAVFGALVAGLGLIVTLVVRSARRARAQGDEAAAPPPT